MLSFDSAKTLILLGLANLCLTKLNIFRQKCDFFPKRRTSSGDFTIEKQVRGIEGSAIEADRYSSRTMDRPKRCHADYPKRTVRRHSAKPLDQNGILFQSTSWSSLALGMAWTEAKSGYIACLHGALKGDSLVLDRPNYQQTHGCTSTVAPLSL